MSIFQLRVTVPETGALSIVPPDFLRGQTVVVRLDSENVKPSRNSKPMWEMSLDDINAEIAVEEKNGTDTDRLMRLLGTQELLKMQAYSVKMGYDKLTLDDVNAEIAEVRRDMAASGIKL